MKTAYLFDGSFEGLLTAVFDAFNTRTEPCEIVSSDVYQEDMLLTPVSITTDTAKADRVARGICSKLGRIVLENCYYTYLSEIMGSGKKIYEYLRLGFKVGTNLDRYLTDDRVKFVLDCSRKVTGERHRMLGLLRFSSIGPGTYFAPIEPLYNITVILAPHFAARFPDQNWIIYDAGRKLAAVYDRQSWYIETNVELQHYVGSNGYEALYRDLWKLYFDNISIKSRENPRLQKSFMPERYWKYLPEKQVLCSIKSEAPEAVQPDLSSLILRNNPRCIPERPE